MKILFALKKGETLQEPGRLGIKYTKSQIDLLKISVLTERKNSIYKTTIPILSNDNAIQLREIIPQFLQIIQV